MREIDKYNPRTDKREVFTVYDYFVIEEGGRMIDANTQDESLGFKTVEDAIEAARKYVAKVQCPAYILKTTSCVSYSPEAVTAVFHYEPKP